MKRAWVLIALCLACETTGAPSRSGGPPGAVWTERTELRLDEMFVADGRGIEIRPVQIDINRALLLVRSDGLSQTIELHTGPGPLSSRTVPPYRIELLSTSIQPSVDLRITRLR